MKTFGTGCGKDDDGAITGPLSSFGEVSVVEVTPTVQLYAVYGLRIKQDVEVFTVLSGTTTVEKTGLGREFKATCGTTQFGSGFIRSGRYSNYRPGQGSLFRFTARFPDVGVDNSFLRVGAIATGNELSIGYKDTNFNLLHRAGGELEMRTLTLTAAATGNETATVTLNSVAFNVAITNGSIKHNIFELTAAAYAGWTAHSNGVTIVFTRLAIGPQSETYSYSSTGTSVGSFAQTNAGVANTDDYIEQADWLDSLDGAGRSGITLDPTKGNVFQIQMQYLGYGAIVFSVENPETGRFVVFHVIKYSNNNTTPSFPNPSFRMGLYAASGGSTTDLSVFSASLMAGIEGKLVSTRNPDSHINSSAGIATALTNVLSIRVRNDINGILNLSEITPQEFSCAVDGTKPAIVRLLINPTFGGEPDWENHEGDTDSPIEIMTTAVAVSENSLTLDVGSYGVARIDQILLAIKDLNIRLQTFDILTLSVEASAGSTDVVGSIIWQED